MPLNSVYSLPLPQHKEKMQQNQLEIKNQKFFNIPYHTQKDIGQLFKVQQIANILLQQINEIYEKCISIICIYQKIFIKFKQIRHMKPSEIHSGHQQEHNQPSLWLLRISKPFPLEGSIRLFMLQGFYEPRVSDTRDYMKQIMGQQWNWKFRLKNVVQNIGKVQRKLAQRNQQYLALQRTGNFILEQTFIYNELQEHSSLMIFVDKNKDTNNQLNNSTLIGVSQTHLLTFKKVAKKCKRKQEQELELKSKTLYGKKYILTRCCQLQCIDFLNINTQTKQIVIKIVKYRSNKFSLSNSNKFNQYQSLIRKFNFTQQNQVKFMRSILKSITKFQTMKIQFIPCINQNQKNNQSSSNDSSVIQKVIQLNQIQNRIQMGKDLDKKDQILNRLNKNYQKLIQYYSARANPYYLIYVNKLNCLYNKYFIKNKQGKLEAINFNVKEKSLKQIN